MGSMVKVISVLALVMIGAPTGTGAEPMASAPTMSTVPPVTGDGQRPANDDHVVGDDLC